MIVAQLIVKLEKYPMDSEVVVSGYEGGVDQINIISEVNISSDNDDKAPVYGTHRVDPEGDIPAIYIANTKHIFINT